MDAVRKRQPALQIVNDVRPGLDFVFGGRGLEMLGQLIKSSMAEDLPTGSAAGEFAARLTEVADDYDLILLDCLPGNGELQDMARPPPGGCGYHEDRSGELGLPARCRSTGQTCPP